MMGINAFVVLVLFAWMQCFVYAVNLRHSHRKINENELGNNAKRRGYVYLSSKNEFVFSPSEVKGAVAWGEFQDLLRVDGWGILSIETSSKYSDAQQAFAAGYLEGALTQHRIAQLYEAIRKDHSQREEVLDFVKKQDIYLRNRIEELKLNMEQFETKKGNTGWKEKNLYTELAAENIDVNEEEKEKEENKNQLKSDTEANVNAGQEEMNTKVGQLKTEPILMENDMHLELQKAAAQSEVTITTIEQAGESYWEQVKLVLIQLDGIHKGYNDYASSPLSLMDFWIMNNDGDILDIERAVIPGRVFEKKFEPNRQELIQLLSFSERCSAIVKYTGNDILVGHNTWSDYDEMNRIYKFYNFNYRSAKTHSMAHSSYPGMIFSSDDFYILDNGLVLLETTINILNEKLYTKCNPEGTVFSWIRNLVANRMASSGKEWTDIYSKYNSGTYNNQWVVVDYNKLEGNKLKPGAVYVLEQIPGYIKIKDMTELVNSEGYWASYNRPYFKEINELSMFKKYADVHGPLFTYQNNVRAKIFKREQSNVNDIEKLKKLMRLNKYQSDPLSSGCPGDAIAARYDLPVFGNCEMPFKTNGATDAKVTNSKLSKVMQAWVIGGPTTDDQSPFNWNVDKYRKQKPAGQPDIWNCKWKIMSPI